MNIYKIYLKIIFFFNSMLEINLVNEICNMLSYFIKFIGIFLSKCERLLTSDFDLDDKSDNDDNLNQSYKINEIEKLKDENKRLVELNNNLDEKIIGKKNELENLNQIIKDQNTEIDTFKEKISNLTFELENKENENEKMKKILSALKK